MNHAAFSEIRLVLSDDEGFGRVSLELETFVHLASCFAIELERLESKFFDWETEHSRWSSLHLESLETRSEISRYEHRT